MHRAHTTGPAHFTAGARGRRRMRPRRRTRWRGCPPRAPRACARSCRWRAPSCASGRACCRRRSWPCGARPRGSLQGPGARSAPARGVGRMRLAASALARGQRFGWSETAKCMGRRPLHRCRWRAAVPKPCTSALGGRPSRRLAGAAGSQGWGGAAQGAGQGGGAAARGAGGARPVPAPGQG